MRFFCLVGLALIMTSCGQQFTSLSVTIPAKQDTQSAGAADAPATSAPTPESTPAVNPTPPPAQPTNPTPSQSYTFDELLPDAYSAFVPLRAGASSLANVHDDPRTGTISRPFPAAWSVLSPGASVRLKILVPPGASLVSWYPQAANMVALLGACDEDGKNCSDKSYPPTLWPVGYNSQATGAVPESSLPASLKPRIVYLTVKALNVEFWFLSLSVTYTIKDTVAYESWRAQRSWAGGHGDCDGLGGVYCR